MYRAEPSDNQLANLRAMDFRHFAAFLEAAAAGAASYLITATARIRP